MFSVSESAIYLRMRSYDLSKLNFTDISDKQLDICVREIARDFPFCGESLFKQLLRTKGIRVQKMRLRNSIQRVDSDGVANRKEGEGKTTSQSI